MVKKTYICTQQENCTFLCACADNKKMCKSFDWGLCTNLDAQRNAEANKLYTGNLRNKGMINRCMIALNCSGFKKNECSRFEGKRKCIFSKGDLCRYEK